MIIDYNKQKPPNYATIIMRLSLALDYDKIFLERFNSKIEEAIEKRGYAISDVDLEFDSFLQIWGNTCTGFDVDENHEAMVGGQMMTSCYTTIVHEIVTNIYFVFFGDKLCYMVYNPTSKFFEDKSKHQMAPLSISKILYETDEK